MLDGLLNVALWSAVGLTVMITSVNALYMMFSPRAWFALPGWLRLNGVLTLDRYGSGRGAMQIRILGVIMIVTIVWVGSRLLFHDV